MILTKRRVVRPDTGEFRRIIDPPDDDPHVSAFASLAGTPPS